MGGVADANDGYGVHTFIYLCIYSCIHGIQLKILQEILINSQWCFNLGLSLHNPV